MRQIRLNKVALLTIAITALCGGALFLTQNTANAETSSSVSSDLIVNVQPVLSLALQNCSSAPDPDETSLTLELTPTPTGTFKSNCQIVSVDTNAPGYTLSAKATGTHPQVPGSTAPNTNLGDTTNSLIYQNPTSLVSPNYPIIQSTSSPISSPTVLSLNPPTTNSLWGFALNQDETNVSLIGQPTANFDNVYTENNQNNKFANLPITDTTIYQTDEFPGQTDKFNFFYAVLLNTSQPAGT
jgi:hypothetical protein